MDLRRAALQRFLGQRLPLTTGRIRVAGPRDEFYIQRDAYSVPHVFAFNDYDAWFALGFCQGQDRSFQLELRLRTARGTLAALVGQQGVAIDRLSRRVGFRPASLSQLKVLAPHIREHVTAFAEGINAGANYGAPLAHEFTLLRSQPTEWDAADVLAAGKLMSFLLVGNWDAELARLKVLELDGEQALLDLDPSYPEHLPVSTPQDALAGQAVDRLSADLALFREHAGAGGASNNWAVAGARTSSGRPILANDPHLDPALPAHWYLAKLRTPDWQVAGATLLGAPAFGAGHNGYCAWGITAGLTDISDLFIEKIRRDGRGLASGEPCEIRTEVIEVKGGTDVIEEVLVTPRGPVIGPALDDTAAAISLRAVWLLDRPSRGFLDVHKARSYEEFRACFEEWPLLPQNVAYADVDGNIGWLLVGETPARERGFGVLPRPAIAGDEWNAMVPLAQMPSEVNPGQGFVASANNKPTRDGEGPYLGVDWLDGYRMARIRESLAARSDWDVASSLKLQLDETTLAWREAREVILALDISDDDARVGRDLLQSWDGAAGADSAAASIFEFFLTEVLERIAKARAPRASQWVRGQGFATLLSITTFTAGRSSRVLRLMREQPEGWFAQGWPSVLGECLAAAVRELRSKHGSDPHGWAWGKVRPLTLRHPLGIVPQLTWLFNRGPFTIGGDGNTISQAAVNPFRPSGNPLAIASLRAVIDVANWDESRFVLPGGQSGNPFSPHYDDQIPLWLEGKGIPIAWTEAAEQQAIRTTLTVAPL